MLHLLNVMNCRCRAVRSDPEVACKGSVADDLVLSEAAGQPDWAQHQLLQDCLHLSCVQLLQSHRRSDRMVALLAVYEEEDEAYQDLVTVATAFFHFLLQPFRDMRELASLYRMEILVNTESLCTQQFLHVTRRLGGFVYCWIKMEAVALMSAVNSWLCFLQKCLELEDLGPKRVAALQKEAEEWRVKAEEAAASIQDITVTYFAQTSKALAGRCCCCCCCLFVVGARCCSGSSGHSVVVQAWWSRWRRTGVVLDLQPGTLQLPGWRNFTSCWLKKRCSTWEPQSCVWGAGRRRFKTEYVPQGSPLTAQPCSESGLLRSFICLKLRTAPWR